MGVGRLVYFLSLCFAHFPFPCRAMMASSRWLSRWLIHFLNCTFDHKGYLRRSLACVYFTCCHLRVEREVDRLSHEEWWITISRGRIGSIDGQLRHRKLHLLGDFLCFRPCCCCTPVTLLKLHE